ncbi:MAG TPA: hypothetical protein VGQ86_04490 [Candidatus Limnocylindria bacterium]|nr:hypothetical protein [Candidatus Limnocylindria bacterium]
MIALVARPFAWLARLAVPALLVAAAFVLRNPIARSTLAALVSSFVLETSLAFKSAFAVRRDYDYGGPLAVGHCHNDFVLSPASACSTSWPIFAIDIALTAVVLMLIMRRWGSGPGLLGSLAGLAALPFIPRSPDGTVQIQVTWIVMMLVVVAVSGLVRGGSDRFGAPRRQAIRTPS